MGIVAQSVTPDAVSITASDGTMFRATSAQAKKFPSPALAQAAFLVALQKQLGQHIAPRCCYIEIDDNFNFAALEQVNAGSADNPPPARKFAFDGAGNLLVTAFDGTVTTIPIATVKGAANPLVYLKAQVATALCGDPTGNYQFRVTLDRAKQIASIGSANVSDVANPAAVVQTPDIPDNPDIPAKGGA
jgi:hypothetical protein